MARPKKTGLDYFPLDVDFFQDIKIIAAMQKFGGSAAAVILGLLCVIYKDKGYYAEYDENLTPFIVARDANVSENSVRLIVKFLLERSMFDNTLFRSDKILTSRRIQLTYQTGKTNNTEVNPVYVDKKYWLLNPQETKGFIKFAQNNKPDENKGYTGENPDKTPDNDTKESKGKERKVNDICAETLKMPSAQKAVITLILNDKSEHPITQEAISQWRELYPAVDVMQELRNMKGWLNANPKKRKTARGILRFVNNWLAGEQDKGGTGMAGVRPAHSDINKTSEEIQRRRRELGL